MNENNLIQQIYDMRMLGGEDVLATLREINKQFIETKKNKQDLNKLKLQADKPEDVVKAANEITKLTATEKALQVELKKKAIALKELNLIAKQESIAKKEAAKENKFLANSYFDVLKRFQELNKISKSTTNIFDPKAIAEATQELNKLKVALDNYNRALSPNGTLVGEYSKGIIDAFKKMGLDDVIEQQLSTAKKQLTDLDRVFDQLTQDFRDMKKAGVDGLSAIEKELIENRKEAQSLSGNINNIETALKGAGNIGTQITQALKDNFSNLKREAVSFFVAYIGFQQAIDKLRASVQINKELSDSFTDLQRILGATDEEIASIEKSLRAIDTRTGLNKLLEFANIAAKAGVEQNALAGVVKAIDDLQLVAGKELGANVEQTVESIIKLINIFEGPGKATEETILRFGNALITLANEGVATGEFLVDFAQRLAGIEGITKIQIQSVLGLAAAFEEQGQSAEVAATAVTQLILKIGADIPKYAALAKVTEDTFRTLVRENPAEALITLAQNLKGSTKEFDEFAALMPELEARGVRVAGTIGVLADKADFFREKISIAGVALQDTTAITEGAAQKQNNFAATIEKINKQFQLLASNKAVQVTLLGIAQVLGLIIGNLELIIGALTAYAAIWTVANAAMIKARVATIASNVAFQAQYAILVAGELITKAYSAAMLVYTDRVYLATAAQIIFNRVILANPLGAVLATLGLLIAAMQIFDAAIFGTTEQLKGQAKALSVLNDIQIEANKRVGEEISKLDTLTAIVKDLNNSYDTRRAALNELIKLNPAFMKALDNEIINVQELARAYNEVTKAIRLKAEVDASASLSAEKQKSVLSVTSLRQRLENETSIQTQGLTGANRNFASINVNDLSEDERNLLTGGFFGNQLTNNTSLNRSARGVSFFARDITKIVDFLKKEEDKRISVYKGYVSASAQKQAELATYEAQIQKSVNDKIASTIDESNLTPKQLQARIDAIEEENKNLQELDPKLRENLKKKKDLQDRLDKALGKDRATSSDIRLSVTDRTAFKGIETAQSDARVKAETDLRQGITDEREYYQALLKIDEDAINKKIALVTNGNTEEKRIAAQLKLDLLKIRKDTQDSIYKIDLDRLEKQRQQQENRYTEGYNSILDNPTLNDTEKSAATANYLSNLIQLQISFNKEMDKLETTQTEESKKNAEERNRVLIDLQRRLNKELRALGSLDLQDEQDRIQGTYEGAIAGTTSSVYNKSLGVFSSGKSPQSKIKELNKIQLDARKEIFDAEKARIDAEIALNKQAFDSKLINERDYNKRRAELQREALENYNNFLGKEVESKTEQRQKLEKINDIAYNFANTIAQSFAEKEQRRNDKVFDEKADQIEKEKELRLSFAQSEEERKQIEEETAEKLKENERQRSIERQENIKKQIILEGALAAARAIAAAFIADPTIGVIKALAAGAEVAAAYTASYIAASQVQFEKGGKITSNGGVFGGKPHSQGGTPFTYGGRGYEAEAGELAIINKRSARSGVRYMVSGTPSQIASAINSVGGGVNFAPGGSIGKFEYGGILGANLSAPNLSSGNNFSDIRAAFNSVEASSYNLMSTLRNLRVINKIGDTAKALNDYHYAVEQSKI